MELPLVISVVSVVTLDQADLQSREVVIIIEYIFRTLYFDKVWHVFIFLPVSQPVSNAADFQIVLIFIPQMSSLVDNSLSTPQTHNTAGICLHNPIRDGLGAFIMIMAATLSAGARAQSCSCCLDQHQQLLHLRLTRS